MFKYPLQSDSFSLLDRLKVCLFVLNRSNKLTMGPKVAELEQKWEQYLDNKASVVTTSSGSTANQLLLETFIQTYDLDVNDITFFCPSTTWASSITPILMRGCKVEFIDINLKDFSFDYEKLEKQVESNQSKVKVIWPTFLIGFVPDIDKLRKIANKYNCSLFGDLAECTEGSYKCEQILSCLDMSTTSFFWAHELCGIEMGALYIRKTANCYNELFENALMIRNHGLTRALPPDNITRTVAELDNPNIDPQFLFYKLGTNLRTTDLNAVWALLDFKRIHQYETHRTKIWHHFNNELPMKYQVLNYKIVPFCLPIIFKEQQSPKTIKELKKKLNKAGWETRPIICFLPSSPAFKYLSKDLNDHPNSAFLARNGLYVGLNNNLTEKDINYLISLL